LARRTPQLARRCHQPGVAAQPSRWATVSPRREQYYSGHHPGNVGLDDGITAHVGRHTFATSFRGGPDLVAAADLLGHARLDTVRACTRPTEDDRIKALNLLPIDC